MQKTPTKRRNCGCQPPLTASRRRSPAHRRRCRHCRSSSLRSRKRQSVARAVARGEWWRRGGNGASPQHACAQPFWPATPLKDGGNDRPGKTTATQTRRSGRRVKAHHGRVCHPKRPTQLPPTQAGTPAARHFKSPANGARPQRPKPPRAGTKIKIVGRAGRGVGLAVGHPRQSSCLPHASAALKRRCDKSAAASATRYGSTAKHAP